MKILNKYTLTAAFFVLSASLASAAVFNTPPAIKSINSNWVHYSNLSNSGQLIDLYVNGTGFRIAGCNGDAYGHMSSKGVALKDYNVSSNLNKPVRICGMMVDSMRFSASKVELSVISRNKNTVEVLQELGV